MKNVYFGGNGPEADRLFKLLVKRLPADYEVIRSSDTGFCDASVSLSINGEHWYNTEHNDQVDRVIARLGTKDSPIHTDA